MERVHRMQLWKDVVGGRELTKGAELAETYDMTSQAVPSKDSDPKKRSKFVIDKTGEAKAPEGVEMELPACCKKEQPPKLPQESALKPHVDVTAHEPPKVVQEKKAERYALPSKGLYPLDNYAQVKMAAQYFMETWKFIPPEDRHEYCGNLVKRAAELNVFTDQLIEKYGSATYASEGDIAVCLDARRSTLQDEDHLGMLDKLAAVRFAMRPEEWATTLREFDKMACLDQYYGDVPDAYYTTFGKQAAQGDEENPEASIVIGNEYLTRRRLTEFAKNNVSSLTKRFGDEVAKGMAKSPNDIFNSLPRDQKLVIMRMANNDDSPVEQGQPTA